MLMNRNRQYLEAIISKNGTIIEIVEDKIPSDKASTRALKASRIALASQREKRG